MSPAAKAARDQSRSDGEAGGDGGRGPFSSAWGLLCRNRELSKVVLASGLQQSASAVADTFVISVLAGTIWGQRMAVMNSTFGIAINIVASVAGGPFGRFGDKVDRRISAAIFGLGSFMPVWAVLVFGPTEHGLYAIMSLKVLGSVASASNVPLALANDVTDFQDREVATGAVFAGVNMLNVTLNGIPVLAFLVFKVMETSWQTMMGYQLALCTLYFVVLCSIDLSSRFDSDQTLERGKALLRQDSPKGTRGRANTMRSTATLPPVERCRAIREPFRLIFWHKRLRRLCASAFLLAFSGSVIMTVSGQFHFQSLGLLPYGTVQELQVVAAVGMLPGQLLVLPGYLLTGYLAKQKGTLTLFRRLIPITAFLKLFGVLLIVVSHLWFLPLVVTAESYTGLAMVPLMRLVAAVAPPGRVGEAMSAVGVSMQAAGLVGNAFVIMMHPLMKHIHMEKQLWIYYPLCAFLHILALLPVTGAPSGAGWGMASGRVEDHFVAYVSASVAGRRWRNRARLSSDARAAAAAGGSMRADCPPPDHFEDGVDASTATDSSDEEDGSVTPR